MKLYYKIFPPLIFCVLYGALSAVVFWIDTGNSIFFFFFLLFCFFVLGTMAVLYGSMVVMTILRIPAVKVTDTHLIVRLPIERVKRIRLKHICGVPQPITTFVGVDFEVSYINPNPKNGLKGFINKVNVPMGLIRNSNQTIDNFIAKLYPSFRL